MLMMVCFDFLVILFVFETVLLCGPDWHRTLELIEIRWLPLPSSVKIKGMLHPMHREEREILNWVSSSYLLSVNK